jgi:hypothetical protein
MRSFLTVKRQMLISFLNDFTKLTLKITTRALVLDLDVLKKGLKDNKVFNISVLTYKASYP